MKEYENNDQATQSDENAFDVEALYAQCIEIEARDNAVGRVLCALVRHMAGASGQDVPAHEAQAVAAMGTQVAADPVEDTTDEPKTAAEDAPASYNAAPAKTVEDKPSAYKYDAKNAAKGRNHYGN